MSKPEDVTDEAWDAARKWLREPVADTHGNHLLYFLSYDFERYGMAVLARAIMAAEKRGEEREREACAQMVDEGYVCRTCGHVGALEHHGCENWNIDEASTEQIAAAIRARSA